MDGPSACCPATELGKVESVPVKQLIEEAFREARAYHPSTSVLLQYESAGEPP